jgi:polyribonucleotide nucleotidyltransferase
LFDGNCLPYLLCVTFNFCCRLSQVKVRDILSNFSLDKTSRDNEITALREMTVAKLKETYGDVDPNLLQDSFTKAFKTIHQEIVFETSRRADGRWIDEVRPLHSEVSLFKPLHGSALFQRGQTQVLGTVSFDSPDSALRLNNFGFADEVKQKKFMLHYEFPKYATNEISRGGNVGRREIGHGALAEKSLRPLVPANFPFTIRLTAEVFESNGSSSMASVCAGSMALMDAGVHLEEHVAGVAMGLLVSNDSESTSVSQESEQEIANHAEEASFEQDSVDSNEPTKPDVRGKHRVLTDITGFEDFYGEMDFKVSGTRKGFTAFQMDCKLTDGVSMTILMEALVKAHEAKSHILTHMNQTIRRPAEGKVNWPVTETVEVPIHKRGAFVGVNGMNLKKLKSETGVTVLANENDATRYEVFAPNQEAMNEAHEFIDLVLKDTKEPMLDFGGIYAAHITELRDNGVLITLYPNMKPVLLHNRELDRRKVSHPSALDLEVGQEIQVKYFGRDPATGDMRISRRVLQMSQPVAKNLISK